MTIADETAEFNAVNAANNEPTQPIDGFDADAPYGRKADGTPKRKPGPAKGTRVGAAIPKPGPRGGTGRKPSAKRSTGTDYRPGIVGMLQIPAFMLSAAGQMNPALALDGAAISMHAPTVAEALNELANENPAVAAALDRILSAGPYGAILGALVPLALQLAANHKALPDGMVNAFPGVYTAGQFEQMLISQQGA